MSYNALERLLDAPGNNEKGKESYICGGGQIPHPTFESSSLRPGNMPEIYVVS